MAEHTLSAHLAENPVNRQNVQEEYFKLVITCFAINMVGGILEIGWLLSTLIEHSINLTHHKKTAIAV